MADKNTVSRNTSFTVLLAGVLILCAFILRPFFSGIAWAVVLSMFAFPLYNVLHEKLLKGRFENVSAFVVSVVILFFMLLPIFLIVLFLAKEATAAYDSVIAAGGIMPVLENVFNWAHSLPVIGERLGDWNSIQSQPYFSDMAANLLQWFSGVAKSLSRNVVNGLARFIMLFVVVGVTSFYLLRDGVKLSDFISDLLPLSEDKKSELFSRMRNMLRAIVFGVVMTGLIQGILGGIGWYIVKLPNPILFGFMMFICGMIPMVGTPAVWIWGVIYLLATGDNFHAFLLLAWNAGIVCTVDNIVRPLFISGSSDVNMFVVFLGLFGGLYLWGFIGLFLGPVVLSLGWFILDIYRKKITEQPI